MNYLSPCGMETRKLVWWKRMQPTKNDIAVAFSLLSLFSRMKILKYFITIYLEKIVRLFFFKLPIFFYLRAFAYAHATSKYLIRAEILNGRERECVCVCGVEASQQFFFCFKKVESNQTIAVERCNRRLDISSLLKS